MGGRGTYSTGKYPKYQYETIGKIGNVKILQPIDKTKSLKLPEESHTSGNAYVLLDKDGIFHQYREYNNNHEVVLEIGYHHEKSIGNGDILHAYIHQKPGIDGHATAKKSLSIREIRYMKNTSIFLWGGNKRKAIP